MYLRWALYLPFNYIFVLSAYVLAPFLAALSLLTGPKLPGFLQWFSTLNGDLDAGLEQNVEGYKPNLKGFPLWWQRTSWIWRNPAQGWQSYVLGMSTEGLVTLEETHNGKNHWFLFRNGKGRKFFCIKRDVPFAFGFYIKVYIGWYNVARDGRNHQYECQVAPKRVK